MFSAEGGVWRYSGHVTNRRGTSVHIAEVVFNQHPDPPETLLPLLEHEDDPDDSTGHSSSDIEVVTAVPSAPPSSRDSLIASSAPALGSPRRPECSDVDSLLALYQVESMTLPLCIEGYCRLLAI